MKKFCKILGWVISVLMFCWFMGNLFYLHTIPFYGDTAVVNAASDPSLPQLVMVGLLSTMAIMGLSYGVGMAISLLIYGVYISLYCIADSWVKLAQEVREDDDARAVSKAKHSILPKKDGLNTFRGPGA